MRNEIRESYKRQDWTTFTQLNVAGRSYEVWNENGNMYARETYTGNCEQITYGKVYKQEKKIRAMIKAAFRLVTEAEDFPEDRMTIGNYGDVKTREEAYEKAIEAGTMWENVPPYKSGEFMNQIEEMLDYFSRRGFDFDYELAVDDEWEESLRIEDYTFRAGEHYC